MRWTSFLLALLTSVLLAGCGLLGKAKNLGTAKGKPNFELVIRAQPEAAQDLLQAHLELNRYRHLEGLRRQDLVRFGKFTRAYTDRPQLQGEANGYTTVFPIHEDVLSLNTKLTQNYGY